MFLILWFKHLPFPQFDKTIWKPFIKQPFFRMHFMKYVYALQLLVLVIPFLNNNWFPSLSLPLLIAIYLIILVIHECIHILIIYSKGDISLTFRGTFFWLHTNAPLHKGRFLAFMSLPFFTLSVLPFLISLFVTSEVIALLLYISWVNTFLSSSDIINTFLIMIKPKDAIFCRGFYKLS